MLFIMLFIFTIFLSFAFTTAKQQTSIGVNYNSVTNNYEVIKSNVENSNAYGYYIKNVLSSGWNYLDVFMSNNTNTLTEHLDNSKSMGFIEGYLSCEEMKLFYPNFMSSAFEGEKPGIQTVEFIKANYKWMQDMTDEMQIMIFIGIL